MKQLGRNDITPLTSNFAEVDNVNIHYLSAGNPGNEPVVLLHGWPTSSYLYRNIIPVLAETRFVVAPDLVGYGASSQPADAPYDLRYHSAILGAFLDHIKLDRVHLVVHDLGGPIGILWAGRNPERIKKLGILNTVLYPDLSRRIRFSLGLMKIPGIRRWIVSPKGISTVMRLGVKNKKVLTPEVISNYRRPYPVKESRGVLYRNIEKADLADLKKVGILVPRLRDKPALILYGKKDILLQPIEKEVRRIKADIPNAILHPIPDAGHFLQEDCPERVARLLHEFL